MTEEQKKNKEFHKGFLQRIQESNAYYSRLSEEEKKEYTKKILVDYEDCPEKRKYERKCI